MREIIFRGRKLTDGKWVEGFLITWPDGYPNIYQPDTYKGYTVEPATVGQYTGLKAENGKRIFEGDIVSTGECVRRVCFRYGAFVLLRKAGGIPMFELIGTDVEYEVLGNIHDNPELLT